MSQEWDDIQEIIDNITLFSCFKDSKVLIAGATGFIGSMLTKVFVAANEKHRLNIRVMGYVRDLNKANRIYKDYEGIEVVTDLNVNCDYVIHTISPTSSKFFIDYPVETIKSSVNSTIDILEFVKKNNASMVYLSSMEQYGVPYEPGQTMTEDMIGLINHLNIRSSYSESKRLCECLCRSYFDEYGIDVKIARLAQTFGAGMSLLDNRMPMQFARAVVDKKNINLHTEGNSVMNYVYITDAINGILVLLRKGKSGEAYNICNDNETKCVRDIAEMICKDIADEQIKVEYDIKDNMGYAPDVKMYLNSDKLKKLGWSAKISMDEAYRRLVKYISLV